MGSGNRLKLGRALEAMPVIAPLMRNRRKEGALWTDQVVFLNTRLANGMWVFQQLDIPCMHQVLCMVSAPYNG